MSKLKPELMIASWPERKVDIPLHDRTSCVSASLNFRLIDINDKWCSGDEFSAARDIGLYIWCDVDGSISIDVRAMDIYSANVKELEVRIKMLKRLTAKAERAGFSFHAFKRDADVFSELTRCIDALGIRRTVEYHGIGMPETYAPVSIAIRRHADALESALSALRQREAA